MPLSEESRVIELKYAAKRFGQMSEDELKLSAKLILLKISTITGWTVPVSELMDILVNQFEKKLLEDYSVVNEEEIEYAFRNKGIEIKDWGKAINLSLIDEVMIPYLEKRIELSKIEESVNKPLEIGRSKQLTNEEWEEWLVDIKRYDFNKIPVLCYDYLVMSGKINPSAKEKNEAIDKAMTIYAASIQEDVRLWNEFLSQKSEGVIIGNHYASLITISKRLIAYNYLKNN